MKFCTYCGKEIADEAVICLSCGCKTQKANSFVPLQATVPSQQILIEETEPQLAIWAKICGIVSFFYWVVCFRHNRNSFSVYEQG